MLVLSRKLGEKVGIGDGITITVVEIDRDKVRLGVTAPRDVKILRQEIADRYEEPPGTGGPVSGQDAGSG